MYYARMEEVAAPTHLAKAHEGELTSYEREGKGGLPFFGLTHRFEDSDDHARIMGRLYAEERPVRYRPGTAVLYRLDGFHRGTAVAAGKLRLNHHLIWRRSHAEWIMWQSFPRPMSSMPHSFLCGLSPAQRGALGFPLPGNPYWDRDTVEAVGKRYKEMDMEPYRARLEGSAQAAVALAALKAAMARL
jgi:hypothetical protein